MSAEMSWSQLLNSNRLKGKARTEQAGRSAFMRDYDRILFSTPFRRLQDKTQVFPRPANDHIHNRLVHSVEVASVGRNLGHLAEETLIKARGDRWAGGQRSAPIGDIVAAACLMHDIGNPAFGHSGEQAISSWFQEHLAQGGSLGTVAWGLTPQQRADLENFEGNAQSFRIVARNEMYRDEGGMRLSYATLGAAAKYPQRSLHRRKPMFGVDEHIARKKFNFFQAEEALFGEVAGALGLIEVEAGCWTRHPLAYLVEAADDICYTILDYEDGVTLGYVGEDSAARHLGAIIDSPIQRGDRTTEQYIGYLRARAMGRLIEQVAQVFVDQEQALLRGELSRSLTELIPSSDALNAIVQESRDKCYNARDVLRIEIAGYTIFHGLLDAFVPAVLKDAGARSGMDKKLCTLIGGTIPTGGPYERLLFVTDYISAMTDSYALQLYRDLNGSDANLHVRGVTA